MIDFFKKLNTIKSRRLLESGSRPKASGLNKGMTYVELIVVLSIFATLSSVAIFNYGDFQARIDIKNLAGDIGLKIVEAQKAALSGLLPLAGAPSTTWKPSYGIFFNLDNGNNFFIYFNDLNNDTAYDRAGCPGIECLNRTVITKDNFIEKIESFVGSTPTLISILSISFTRPDSKATFNLNGTPLTGVDYVKITLKSPKGATASIQIFPSGRIQIN